MDKYVCMICGYIYDEEQGDASSNIQAATKWQDIPDSWKCPICKAQKSAFSLKQSSNIIKVPDDNLKSVTCNFTRARRLSRATRKVNGCYQKNVIIN